MFLPNRLEKIPKKSKKYNYGIILSQNRLEKAVKERKQKLSFHYVPSQPVRENSKNTTVASFEAKIGLKRAEKESK